MDSDNSENTYNILDAINQMEVLDSLPEKFDRYAVEPCQHDECPFGVMTQAVFEKWLDYVESFNSVCGLASPEHNPMANFARSVMLGLSEGMGVSTSDNAFQFTNYEMGNILGALMGKVMGKSDVGGMVAGVHPMPQWMPRVLYRLREMVESGEEITVEQVRVCLLESGA